MRPTLRLIRRAPVCHPRYAGDLDRWADPALPDSDPGSSFRVLRGAIFGDLGDLDHDALARVSWAVAAELTPRGAG